MEVWGLGSLAERVWPRKGLPGFGNNCTGVLWSACRSKFLKVGWVSHKNTLSQFLQQLAVRKQTPFETVEGCSTNTLIENLAGTSTVSYFCNVL